VYALLFTVVATITTRLLMRQVLEYRSWQSEAVENYTSEISDPAPRGIIYDRNGYILARNVASYNIVITPAGLPMMAQISAYLS
jgi:penicillin-binding protein 2